MKFADPSSSHKKYLNLLTTLIFFNTEKNIVYSNYFWIKIFTSDGPAEQITGCMKCLKKEIAKFHSTENLSAYSSQ